MARKTIAGKDLSSLRSEEVDQKLAELANGQVMVVNIRKVSTDDAKVMMEAAERVSNPNSGPRAAIAYFNTSDKRFGSGARRAWTLMEREIANKMFNTEIPQDKAYVELGITLKPRVVTDEKGKMIGVEDFRIQITEVLESQATQDELDYPDNFFKRLPSTGEFFYDSVTGERVGSRQRLVMVERPGPDFDTYGDPKNIFIEGEYKSIKVASKLKTKASIGAPKIAADLVS